MPNFCAAPNCTRKSTQSDLAFFRFPRDPARCQKWVENCRRADLEDKTPDQLNKHYRLCAKHFETSMICRTSPYRTVLRDNAIPTIFDLTSHLNNPHSRHRKRIKELSEDEIRTLKQKKIDETSEQEQKHKETNNSNAQNPSAEEGDQQDEDILPLTLEEKENKEYLKSLFEILILMGKQNIPLDGHEADEIPDGLFTPDNFQALLECRINSGEEVLRKRFETTAVNTLFCSKTQQKQMLEICESCIREETLREVRDSHFFSIITDDVVDIAGEEHLPVLNSEERGKELKEICHSQWTGRHDAFEILVDLLQALVLCLDGINSDTNTRWNNCIAGRAFVLCSAVTDFDFIVTVVVLKNVLSFTRAFGKNLQGQTSDVFFAASSLTAVLHSLNEVMENIEVYHEFWFEEATNLATKLDIQMKLPGKFRRAQQGNVESQLTSESYYKETLSVPTVEHIIQELKDIFSEQHLKALKCLSLVPSVMGQLKFNTSEEHHADMYRSDLPNPDTLSAELHCWRIKWKHRGKDIELPSTIYEALHLPDIKFFPNVYALLKVLCILPVMKVENERYENGRKRLKAYLRNTLTDQRSSNLALLNINFDIKHDLDLMVDTYIKLYTTKSELPTDNSETIENT
ncbi:52 kDa repressor of the inhibitor of the protein kinase isoform X2 [Dipodomys merriami]|uniref:52 kDa repressor of the inhibitor of the protein kinase isoform X2 n=1 Tax=Dipodomys merriami TaxID=94247 RepID=UPI0038558E86